MGYPKERKEAVLKKMLPPNNKTIPEIAKEEGICEGTLYNWRKAARAEGCLLLDGDSTLLDGAPQRSLQRLLRLRQ
ncbi:MAG: helix-turn-helix domain-containing protein [Candidatus Thiodiazotropha sp. (ex Lucinoma aequizonata)]|nr:helix-turn-helix domain-containing protein [Candidatus Thiodiazotropha sp. (ex Lucinoma aequizonata)]MCU7889391.1 helix-turn-helix domain-containing protein [Candidatus Thiodiazotropha sp. (ex Lucinoma aequizonata)]MCU7893920.1 helix-turn-helix domain-containing protein [Candidatus Thiodiazotropha sp. (ex Lucinoma aequizonata)]MCU7899887.1 helix-turn-helix domain-containing protein [Candidatus Thiodiazotropha sp. (ex Lucinoma aequizonata)]MCU7902489.1 helix-turn-helix domain-containing prote